MSSDPFPIYEGPTPFADLLREQLAERGILSILRAVGPFLGIIGDAARTPFSLVLVSAHDWEHRRDDVEECVALLLPSAVQAAEEGEVGDESGGGVP